MSFTKTVAVVLLHLSVAVCQTGELFDCPERWQQFDSKCYKFQFYPADLRNASEKCQTYGATLVSVNSHAEHSFIADWLATNEVQPRKWYTSGRQYPGVDTAEWDGDGSEIKRFQSWLSDKDRNASSGAIVYDTDGMRWGWTLIKGNESLPYICEISRGDIYQILSQDRNFGYGENTTDPSTFERGPRFVIEPKYVTYDRNGVDEYATMTCYAEGYPYPTYSWYLVENSIRQKVTVEGGHCRDPSGRKLIYKPTKVGVYQCIAENKFGSILSKTAKLNIGYIEEFRKGIRDPFASFNRGGAVLDCYPTKHLFPTILFSWSKDDPSNFLHQNVTPYIFISNNGRLYFSSVSITEDGGLYYCVVTTPQTRSVEGGSKYSPPIELFVRESGPAYPYYKSPMISSDFPQVFPRILKRGDDVRVECFAWGVSGDEDRRLNYTWSRVDGMLPSQSTITDEGRVLNIPNIKLSDFGVYTCTCSNQEASDAKNVTLPVASAPFPVVPLTDQIIDRGTDLTWHCLWGGTAPKVRWYRDSVELDPANLPAEYLGRYSIQRDALIIANVNESDNGMYQCGATNVYGSRFSSAQLKVVLFKPSFSKRPLQPHLNAVEGGTFTIVCQPEAAPRAINGWQKNGTDLELETEKNAHFRLMRNGNLRIQRVTPQDGGNYTCIAKNTEGEARSTGLLIVDRFEPYDDVRCSSVKIVSREEWGARPPKNTIDLKLPVGNIFLHHTAMEPCLNESDCIEAVRKLQDFHMDDLGWSDIRYHYLVDEDGYAYEGRGWDHQGPQVDRWNKVSFGISVIGNFMNTTPNAAALNAAKGLIDCALQKGKLDHKNFAVCGHRDGGQTTCPGTAFYELIQDWPQYGGPLQRTATSGRPIVESGGDLSRQFPVVVGALVILAAIVAYIPLAPQWM